MTAIAGLVHGGRVYIGGDSAGTSRSFAQTIRADEKVFLREAGGERFLFGICGSFRGGNLLRYRLAIPEPYTWEDLSVPANARAYMTTRFIDEVRAAFKEYGHLSKEKEEEGSGTAFLLGFRGNLYLIESDFQVGLSEDTFAAAGSGEDLVLGSLYSTENGLLKDDPEGRIRTALLAASRFNAAVRPPFVVASL